MLRARSLVSRMTAAPTATFGSQRRFAGAKATAANVKVNCYFLLFFSGTKITCIT